MSPRIKSTDLGGTRAHGALLLLFGLRTPTGPGRACALDLLTHACTHTPALTVLLVFFQSNCLYLSRRGRRKKEIQVVEASKPCFCDLIREISEGRQLTEKWEGGSVSTDLDAGV